jgi:hypothetical protein
MLQTVAWGKVDSDGTLLFGRGLQGSARTGVGAYEITLLSDFQLDDTEMMITLTPTVDESRSFNVMPSSDLVKEIQVRSTDGAFPVDTPFYFKIERLNIL